MTTPADIIERLDHFRQAGYGWIYEEFAEGINSVAAPLLDQRGTPIGAIHIHGPAFRFPGSNNPDEIGELLVEETRRYSLRVDSA
jgi:DNA-binding IclR family transcriptional regulator